MQNIGWFRNRASDSSYFFIVSFMFLRPAYVLDGVIFVEYVVHFVNFLGGKFT